MSKCLWGLHFTKSKSASSNLFTSRKQFCHSLFCFRTRPLECRPTTRKQWLGNGYDFYEEMSVDKLVPGVFDNCSCESR